MDCKAIKLFQIYVTEISSYVDRDLVLTPYKIHRHAGRTVFYQPKEINDPQEQKLSTISSKWEDALRYTTFVTLREYSEKTR